VQKKNRGEKKGKGGKKKVLNLSSSKLLLEGTCVEGKRVWRGRAEMKKTEKRVALTERKKSQK